MKLKLLFTAASCMLAMFGYSQSQRMVLVEHFTQASCGPCAGANPTLHSTLTANPTKVTSITHQVSWPGTDPMNAHYPAGPNDRRNYYGVSGVPNTVLDGTSGPGAPNTVVTQSTIDTRYAVASPFDLTLSFSKSGGVITANLGINCTQAVSGNLVAHIAVIEKEINFASAPGSNGETTFHNVLKQYLPSTSGTSLANSWTVGQTQTINESWTWSNVYDENELAVVAFIQNNTTKEVHQAVFASAILVPDDAGISGVTNEGNQCTTSYAPAVTLRNFGSNTLNSATINYNVNGGANQTYNWTGSLASGASTVVTLPAMTLTTGINSFNASTSNPNGTTDGNTGNDANTASLSVGTSPIDLALSTDCWGSEVSWEIKDASNNVWASGGGYPNVSPGGATYNHNLCLAEGACYDFVINDTYGDGMAGNGVGSCTVNGTYAITDGSGATLASMQAANSDFGNQETNNFCITSVPPVDADFTAAQTSLCPGATVNFSDNSTSSPTTWSWSFPGGTPNTSTQQNPTITYNTPGTYSVTLTAGNGTTNDTQTLNSYITVNAAPNGTTSIVDAACGQSNGSASVTATGGSAPYSYSWSPSGGSGATASNLSAGAYNVTITDANGCTSTTSANVGNQGGPTVVPSSTNAGCAQNDGAASVNVSGGQAPYTYSWSPNVSTSSSATGLVAGTYNVTVTDANSCVEVVTITISALPLPSVAASGTDEVCEGDCDGTLNAAPSGGTSPYSYNWDNSIGSGDTHTNVCPGNYTVTITDANGCTSTDTYTVAAGAANPVPVFTSSANQVTLGTPISFTNTSTNGTSYSWDFGDGNSSVDMSPSHTYASAGTYTVTLTVTNAAGCSASTTATIVVDESIGLSENDLDDKIQLYPNPTTGKVEIVLTTSQVQNVTVVTPLGQTVEEHLLNGKMELSMDLGHLSNGLYFLVFTTGNSTTMKQLIVRK